MLSNGTVPQRLQSYMDIEKLEKEFVLTMAEYSLAVANVKWTFSGIFSVDLETNNLECYKFS